MMWGIGLVVMGLAPGLGLAGPLAQVAAPLMASLGSGSPGVVINEVLYDPDGKDGGLEFVELHNRGTGAVCLGGWRLESGNGAGPGRWTLEWTGGARDSIAPGGFFVIGEEMVEPEPEAVADLDLQNGPDACRLVSPEGARDLVGWGDHTYDEYYEGEPAAEAGSGRSLGRDPDGVDTDVNAQDFADLAPSPSGFNRPPCDLALAKAGRSRYTPLTSAEIDLACLIRNDGSDTCGAGAGLCAGVAGREFSSSLAEGLAPGEDLRATVRIPNPGEGLHLVALWIACDADPCSANDSLSTSLVVPPGPLAINEIMFRPEGTDCEWLEILNRSPSAVSIAGWTIEDSNVRPRVITADDLAIGPGQFLVLVEDEGAFAATYPDPGAGSGADSIAAAPAVVFRPAGGWPTLNDVEGPLGFADAVAMRDPLGTAVDSVAYGAGWAGSGVSVERIDPASPAPEAPCGTSSAASSASTAAGDFTCAPAPPRPWRVAGPYRPASPLRPRRCKRRRARASRHRPDRPRSPGAWTPRAPRQAAASPAGRLCRRCSA